MQNDFLASSLTNDCSQVTPSSAFRSTIPMHSSTPAESIGIRRPSLYVRSTTYLGMSLLLSPATLVSRSTVGEALRAHIGAPTYLRLGGYLSWRDDAAPCRLDARLHTRLDVELAQN